jgi:hypothetical protein
VKIVGVLINRADSRKENTSKYVPKMCVYNVLISKLIFAMQIMFSFNLHRQCSYELIAFEKSLCWMLFQFEIKTPNERQGLGGTEKLESFTDVKFRSSRFVCFFAKFMCAFPHFNLYNLFEELGDHIIDLAEKSDIPESAMDLDINFLTS